MYRKVLKQDSDEKVAFLLSMSKGLSQLDFSALNSVTGLDLLSETISGLFADCWATYAKRITMTTHSKECGIMSVGLHWRLIDKLGNS